MREWRNWQTRTFEGRVVHPYGFKSRFSHHITTIGLIQRCQSFLFTKIGGSILSSLRKLDLEVIFMSDFWVFFIFSFLLEHKSPTGTQQGYQNTKGAFIKNSFCKDLFRLVITHIAKIQIFFKKIMLKSTKIIIFKEII